MSVEPPEFRKHAGYMDKDVWEVVDVGEVDRLFLTRTAENEVRIDLDGIAQPSSDPVDHGDRVNVSARLPRDQLLELAEKVREQEDPEAEVER